MILNASRRILFLILTLVSGLGFWGGQVWGQTSTQDFGTGTGSHTSQTGSTLFIPNPTTGTTWVRAGITVPNAPIVLATASNPLGTTGTFVRGVASTSTSVTKFSPIVGYTGSTEFYTSFKVLFGDASAGSTATSGSWTFYQGNGAMYSDAGDFTGAQVFTGLRFTYGAGGSIALSYRGGSSFVTTGLTTSTFSSATTYLVEIIGNNKTTGTINYTYNGISQAVAVQKFDLYINGTKIGDDLAEAQLPSNTFVNSGTFIGISSSSNVANIFVDDVVVYYAIPPAITNTYPILSVSPTSLNAFAYAFGSGPSASQAYVLNGINLSPANADITVVGSTNYEVSSDNISFTGSLTIPYIGGSIENTNVYIRLKAGLGIGSYNGELIMNSGGTASSVNVACNGNVTCAIPINTLGAVVTESFNSLANTGTSSSLPCGWFLSESGSNANTIYTAGTGSSATGDTYSFGIGTNADRAFGALFSANLIPIIGAQYQNKTGDIINSLTIQYTGEQWRLGALARPDRLDFQISFNASSLNTGTWTDFNILDFNAPVSAGTLGALDGNTSPNNALVSSSISGASIPNESTFWIRWNDFDATGSDDGLAVDDLNITASNTCLAPTVQASNILTSSPDGNTVNLSWTNGNGYKRMVIINTVNSFTDPLNGTDPSAFASYSGSGEQVVYNGSGNSCTITDLIPNTQYCFRVYEYNCSDIYTLFLTTIGANNPNCTTTPICGVTVSSYTPPSGPVGTQVSITGTNMTSGTTVSINGLPAAVTFISTSLIVATIPGGATSGPIKVSDGCNAITIGLFTVIDISCATPASDLFISEYVEGSSNNKAIEIANFTGSAKSLSGYSLEMYFNGAITSTSIPLQNVSLENNQVWVVVPENASASLKAHSNQISSIINWFNGNDAVVLQFGTTKIDIFGNIGCDPGSIGWSASGFYTKDQTLERKSNILTGVSTNPGGDCPFPTLTTEWNQSGTDVFTNLGSHAVDNSGTPATITSQPSSAPVCPGSSISFSLVASGAINYQWKYFDGSDWVNVVDEVGVYSGSQSTSLTITGASGLNGLQYYCEVYSTPTCFVVSNAAQLKVGDIWIGNNSDWNSNTNWCTGAKPDQSTDVIIPTSPFGSNMPEIGTSTTADCRDIEIQSGASLIIQSNLTSSGSLIANGKSIVAGTIKYNRYVEAEKWHILSSPLYNTGNQTALAISNVALVDGKYNVAPYNELLNIWDYQSSLPIPFAQGKGYVVKLLTGNTNVGFTGILNTTMTNVAVQSTGGYYGWNSVGNPFTSSLKITEDLIGFIDVNSPVLESNYSAIYLWSADASGYKVISKSGYTPKYGFGSFSDAVVQAGQGFLINVKSPQSGDAEYPNGTIHRNITFNHGTSGMQIHSTATTLKKSEASWPGLTLLATNNCRTRSTIVAFNKKMTTGLDPSYDAGLLSVSDFNVHTHLVAGGNETSFTIQCLPDTMYSTLSVPVGIDLPQPGALTFKVAGVILPEGIYPVIEDRLLQLNTPLKTETDSLTVDIAVATRGTGRFYLHFGGTEINTGIKIKPETRNFTAHYANQKISLFGTPEQGSRAWLYDINGRKLSGEYRLTSENQNEIPAIGLSSGIYLLKIEGKTNRQILKITILNR